MPPIRVNDNASPADEFQPNLAAAANGTVSVNFYDRRLACPSANSPDVVGAGSPSTRSIALQRALPPYAPAITASTPACSSTAHPAPASSNIG